MFGIDLTARSEINRVIGHINDAQARQDTNTMAIIVLLVQKGIITPEEWNRARLEAIAPVEQLIAQKSEEVRSSEWEK